MSADEVALHRPAATVGNVGELDAGHAGEQFGGNVRARADTGGRIGDLARLFLRQRDQVGDAAHWQRRMDHENLLVGGDEPDRREILAWVVAGIAAVEAGRHGEEARMADHQRVAVGRRLGGRACADGAGRPAAVFDDELLTKRAPHVLAQQPRQNVVAAARRERHHDGDGTRGVGLRARRASRGREHGARREQRRRQNGRALAHSFLHSAPGCTSCWRRLPAP